MHRMPKLAGLAASIALVAGLFATGAADAGTTPGYDDGPPGSYIIQVDPAAGDVLAVVQAAIAPLGGQVEQTFTQAINGAVVTLPAGPILDLLDLPGILTVEPNSMMHVSQTNPPWGLDRTDQRDRPLDGTYAFATTGAGVDAYVIDTGIRFSHSDFGGRAVSGFDAIDGGAADDCHGHGTHVAGTLGGATYGVAKAVRLIGVRVLDCQGSGTNAQVISGIEWAIANHAPGQPAVANMSLGGGASRAIDTAIANLGNDGVTVVVAAGNESADACGSSPARVPAAVTVAASDTNDALASFSNGGPCVDIIAPGVGVLSASSTGDTDTATMSGTSMATPHVAGAAARFLQAQPAAAPAAVEAGLVANATAGKMTGTARSCRLLILLCRPATPNRLLHAAANT